MDNTTFSDGSRIVYLAAGNYLVSRGARISRVQTPDRDSVAPSQTNVGSDDGQGSDLTEQAAQVEDIARQAISANEDSQEGAGSALEDTLESGSQHEGQVGATWGGHGTPPTPGGPYYDNDSVMTDNDQQDNHPSVGGLTVTSQGPSQTIRVPHQGIYIAQNLLSKDIFAHMAATTYDPLWIQSYNVNPAVMNGFTSRIKLEEMFGRGVFELGDCFQLLTDQGVAYTATEAIVSSLTIFRPGTFD